MSSALAGEFLTTGQPGKLQFALFGMLGTGSGQGKGACLSEASMISSLLGLLIHFLPSALLKPTPSSDLIGR